MQWFTAWWEALTTVQQVLACMAIPATILLVLQTVLLLFGVGGGHDVDHGMDMEHDLDHDLDHDHDAAHSAAGLRIFTIRGFVAFFAVGGWLGIALLETGLNAAVSCLIALAGGFLSLMLVALFLKWSLSLQEEGNLSLQNAVGHTAQVYLTIPPDGQGTGKVTLTVQERYVELAAMTQSEEPIKVGKRVEVVGLVDETTLLVKPQ